MFKKSMFKGLLFLQIIFLGIVMISCGAKKPSVTENKSVSNKIENKEITQINTSLVDSTAIPAEKADKVPIYPGCESKKTESERKTCLSKKIQDYVLSNFDTEIGEKNDIHGKVKFVIKFEINKDGKVSYVSAKGPHPKLEEEAIRVVSSLPKMIPAEYKGERVSVSYTLPLMLWFR